MAFKITSRSLLIVAFIVLLCYLLLLLHSFKQIQSSNFIEDVSIDDFSSDNVVQQNIKQELKQEEEIKSPPIKQQKTETNSYSLKSMKIGNEEFYAITISTKVTGRACQLIYSAIENDIIFNVVGYGMTNFTLSKKIDIMFKEIEKIKNPNAIILFVDAFDVIILQSAVDMVKKFTTLYNGKSIIYNGEKNCHPFGVVERTIKRWGGHEAYCEGVHPKTSSPFKYLNSGAFIGRQKKLLEFYKLIINLPNDIKYDLFDDQGMSAYVWLTYARDYVTLDYNADLFLSLLEVDAHGLDLQKVNDHTFKTKFKQFNNYISMVHGNGWGKWQLDIFISRIRQFWDFKTIHDNKSDILYLNGKPTHFNELC
ncbi:hypothetical protein ABK040_006798 [Willaertia magna]